MLAEQGLPLDPERIKALSQKLKKQVRRANLLVMNLNRLAHTSDLPARETTLGDNLGLVCALAERSASLKEVHLKANIPDRSAKFAGYAFHLNQLIWYCVEYAIQTAAQASTVEITFNAAADTIRILFQPLETPGGSINDLLIGSEPVKALLAESKAVLSVDRDQKGLELAFANTSREG